MDPVSAVLITKALDGLSLRQLATAENIANANSRGFQPLRVNFEELLKAAASEGVDAVHRMAPQIERTTVLAGDEMRLDLELATASETAMRYTALIDVLNRQMQISRVVITGGQ